MHYLTFEQENIIKQLLNSNDPLDRLIGDAAKTGEFKVGFVAVKPQRFFFLKKHLPIFVKH
jgi:hypothetical protein